MQPLAWRRSAVAHRTPASALVGAAPDSSNPQHTHQEHRSEHGVDARRPVLRQAARPRVAGAPTACTACWRAVVLLRKRCRRCRRAWRGPRSGLRRGQAASCLAALARCCVCPECRRGQTRAHTFGVHQAEALRGVRRRSGARALRPSGGTARASGGSRSNCAPQARAPREQNPPPARPPHTPQLAPPARTPRPQR